MTIDELHKGWIEYKSVRVKPTSIFVYENHYQRYILPYFTGVDMAQGVNNKQMTQFVEHLMLHRHLSQKSAMDVKVALTTILKFGSMQHGIPLYAYNIEYPKDLGKSRGLQYFSRDHCKTVFKAMEEDPSSELLGIVIGLTTGMRIGEIVGLKFEDVDFEAKTVAVNRTIGRMFTVINGKFADVDGVDILHKAASGRSAIISSPPKTISSRRTCPLAALPLKWLRAYRKTSTPGRYIVGLGKKPIEPRLYRNIYYEILKNLGLPALHPHCMRHTFATQMLHSGVDPATTASILGHSSPAITLEIYSHTDEDEKRKRVNAVFGKMFKI